MTSVLMMHQNFVHHGDHWALKFRSAASTMNRAQPQKESLVLVTVIFQSIVRHTVTRQDQFTLITTTDPVSEFIAINCFVFCFCFFYLYIHIRFATLNRNLYLLLSIVLHISFVSITFIYTTIYFSLSLPNLIPTENYYILFFLVYLKFVFYV